MTPTHEQEETINSPSSSSPNLDVRGRGSGGDLQTDNVRSDAAQTRSPFPRQETNATLPPYASTIAVPVYISSDWQGACSVGRAKGYLLLLASFSKLIDQVRGTSSCISLEHSMSEASRVQAANDSTPSPSDSEGPLLEECRVALFVEMAVRRFGYWQERLLALKSTALPPLDVLLVWATYLGSPVW